MKEITKASVLERFMDHYNRRPGIDPKRRALDAYNETMDSFVPWTEAMPDEDLQRRHRVIELLNEIMAEDFKIEIRTGRKYTPTELAGTEAGGMAAQEFLKGNADRVPPIPQTAEAGLEWQRTVKAWAFELVPQDRTADKEWTYGFMAGFSGDLWRHAHGLPGIDATRRAARPGAKGPGA